MLECDLTNAIFVPSGDHTVWLQPWASGSAFAPPQSGVGWTLISCRPVPSACTTQIELCTSGVRWTEKTISFPCGDQSPVELRSSKPAGVICLSPVPLVLTTNKPSELKFESNRWKTILLPFGDHSPGMSSPPGLEVICARPPPSEERIVWMPFWLPSSLNVSQRRRVPSGDGVPQGLNRFGSCPPTSRHVPSSVLMIREPPPGRSGAPPVATWIPSGNHIGLSPVSVGAWTSRWPVPSGLMTFTCVSPSSGLYRPKASSPFIPRGLAPAGSANTAASATTRSARSATRRTRPPNENFILASLSPEGLPRTGVRQSPAPTNHWVSTDHPAAPIAGQARRSA